MRLCELSVQYRAQADRLKERIQLLEQLRRGSRNQHERAQLTYRIQVLRELWREARDLAVLTERYYERGYRRNGKYTL